MSTRHPASEPMPDRDRLKNLYKKFIECPLFKKIVRTPWMLAGAVVGAITVFGLGFTLVISILWFAFSSDQSPDAYTEYSVNRANVESYGYHRVYGDGFRSQTGMSHGTFDQSGGGNHVISVDGEVLNLPPY